MFHASPILLWCKVGSSRQGSDRDRSSPRSRSDLADARRNCFALAVVAGAVLRRRLADDLGEARTERAERRATDCDAGVGDRHRLTQKSLRPLDPTCHEVGVRSLAIRRPELAREMSGRHERGSRHRRDVEGLRVAAVHEVARPAQVNEVGNLLRRHACHGTRPTAARGHDDGSFARNCFRGVRTCAQQGNRRCTLRSLSDVGGTRCCPSSDSLLPLRSWW